MALQNIFYKLSRQEIAQIFKSPRAVQAYEKLQDGLSSDVIDAINQAQADADAAQVTADAAAIDASNALNVANQAQADAQEALDEIAALVTGVPVYMQQTEPTGPAIWFKTDGTGAVIDIMQVT